MEGRYYLQRRWLSDLSCVAAGCENVKARSLINRRTAASRRGNGAGGKKGLGRGRTNRMRCSPIGNRGMGGMDLQLHLQLQSLRDMRCMLGILEKHEAEHRCNLYPTVHGPRILGVLNPKSALTC